MYIGSTASVVEETWVADCETSEIRKKVVTRTPAFEYIFKEVLDNAVDHSIKDDTVTKITVVVDQKTNEISVLNDGTGIPVQIHAEHKVYIPELVFGHLLSGSNYDDTRTRTGCGQNGLGVKLTNVFSVKFTVETCDGTQKYTQEWTKNMSVKGKPKVRKFSGKQFTKVTYIPDLHSFGMESISDDTLAIIAKRVYDCVVCTRPTVQIHFNGVRLKGKNIVDYSRFYTKEKVFQCELAPGWDLVLFEGSPSETVSFVNGNCTTQGGTHITNVINTTVAKIKETLETKRKIKDSAVIRPSFIRDSFFWILRSTVPNPSFSSQTKECLTTPATKFGVKITVSDAFIAKIIKDTSIVESMAQLADMKSAQVLTKTDGIKRSRVFIPNLEDARFAGTGKSRECTLIVTEGLSAQTFALWGRSVVGIDTFGVFPLRGKLLNVRGVSPKKVSENTEITAMKQILGLKQNRDYSTRESLSELRYGTLLVLTDQDVDGTHIRSLVVNWIHAYWPGLLTAGFVHTLRTPIIKANGPGLTKSVSFFTEQDYSKWAATARAGYRVKYYKGLGTSQKEDAKNTFRDYDTLKVEYVRKDVQCDNAVLLAFDKEKDSTTDRKNWLREYSRDEYIRAGESVVSVHDLIHRDLVHFSVYDNLRSIPHVYDGLKPSQRKIIWYCLNRKVKESVKVAQLSGYIGAETSYHHGEVSLQSAIVGMARDFIGTNNVPLLFPDGNFGSRMHCKDAASARYIYTRLQVYTPKIFRAEDTPLLQTQTDDGHAIEPVAFLPIVPMVLVNGADGIGTGFSTYVPPHSIESVLKYLVAKLTGKDTPALVPHFRNFKGTVAVTDTGFTTTGLYSQESPTKIVITELPIGMWVGDYKEFLESMVDGNGGSLLKDVVNASTDENTGIRFELVFKSPVCIPTFIKDFKLSKTFSTRNMYLFNGRGCPEKYESTSEIADSFFTARLDMYSKRRDLLIRDLESALVFFNAKHRFITEYTSGLIEIHRVKIQTVREMLESRGYPKKDGSYTYLLGLSLSTLTLESLAAIEREIKDCTENLDTLKNSTPNDLWIADIRELVDSLNAGRKSPTAPTC
jgi:DNA topoisomerase-2